MRGLFLCFFEIIFIICAICGKAGSCYVCECEGWRAGEEGKPEGEAYPYLYAWTSARVIMHSWSYCDRHVFDDDVWKESRLVETSRHVCDDDLCSAAPRGPGRARGVRRRLPSSVVLYYSSYMCMSSSFFQ